MSQFYKDEEFDWESNISQDSEFTLLPEGDYKFTVVKFERARHQGSAKLPACNKAVLTIKVESDTGESTTITHNLFLHKKCEGLLCEFFNAIGLRKHGETFTMNWNEVPMSTGMCHVFVDEYTNKDGEKRQSNKIKRFLEPKQSPVTTPKKTWSAGSFGNG